jgi:hypothetical protein
LPSHDAMIFSIAVSVGSEAISNPPFDNNRPVVSIGGRLGRNSVSGEIIWWRRTHSTFA